MFGLVCFTSFYSYAQPNPVAGEYFIGNFDPGQGLGTALSPADGAWDQAVENAIATITVSGTPGSTVLFNVRLKDSKNNWGPLFKKAVFISSATTATRTIGVTAAEYFFGQTDPGQGLGTALVVFDSNYGDAVESVFKDAITYSGSNGAAIFNIRVKDSYNNWGPLFKKVFFNQTAITTTRTLGITSAEYFFGQFDPGQGLGTSLIVFDGNYGDAIESVYKDAITYSGSNGAAIFNIRVKDSYNNWGPLFKKVFFNQTAITTTRTLGITSAEYFFGQFDPGQGLGTALIVFDGNYGDAVERVLKDSITYTGSNGAAIFNIRVKDSYNNWGPLFKKTFFNQTATNTTRTLGITSAEYFFGQFDPGQGLGTALIVFDGNYGDAVERVLKDSITYTGSNDAAIFNIRVKDSYNNWGPLFKKVFFNQTATTDTRTLGISNAEYFFGQFDPGQGLGTPLIVFDGNYGDAVESAYKDAITYSGSNGVAIFNIRVKDSYNNWGPLFKKVLFKEVASTSSRSLGISNAEYFIGQFDPGEGNGTPILYTDGNFGDAVETLLRTQLTWANASGPVLFNIRVKDSYNNWGSLFKKAVFPLAANPNAQLISQGDTLKICPESPASLTYSGPEGYAISWFNGSTENSISFVPTVAGFYKLTATLGTSVYLDSIYIAFLASPPKTITPSGTIIVCAQTSLTLTTTSNALYTYQWKYNGSNIVGSTTNNYLPSQTGTYTCYMTQSSSGCTRLSDSVSLVTAVSITATTASGGCLNSNSVLSVPFGSQNTYQWQSGTTNIVGATSNTYRPGVTGVYRVIVTSSSGPCTVTTSTFNFDLTTSLTASITPSGNQNICSGQSVLLTANTGTGYSYQWKLNGANITGATASSYSANQAGYYTVVVSNQIGCSVTSAATLVQVNTSVVPSVSITQTSGTNPSCTGQSLSFAASALNGGASPVYQWKVNGLNVGTNSPIFTSSSLISASVISCILTSNQICATPSNVSSNSITLTVNPLPIVSAGAYSNLLVTSAPITLAGSPSGGTFTGTGVSGNTFNPAVSGGGTFTITYTYTNPSTGCTNSATTTITVSATCNFTVGTAIAGNTNACGNIGVGDSAVYSIATTGALSFTWYVSNTATMGISAVNNGSSVKIKYASTFTTGTITLVVTGCNGTSVTKTLAVTKTIPGTPASITGVGGSTPITYICPYVGGSNITYVATPPATNASAVIAYRWTLPTGAVLVSVNATDSSSITLNFPVRPTTLALSVIAVSGCGNSAVKSLTLNATAPVAPLAITGLADVCASIGSATQSGNITYSIAPVNNASSYLWAVPAGVTLISGQGTTSINVVFASSFVSGNISAQSISPCGNSTAKTLTVYKRVAAAITAVQKQFTPTSVVAVTSVCGLTSETYRIKKVTYATSYNWILKVGTKATITHINPLGITDTAVIVTFLSGFTKDTLSVAAVTPCSVSASKTTALSSLYAPPTVTSLTGTGNNFTPCIGDTVTYTASATVPTSIQSAISVYRWTRPNFTTIISATADSASIKIRYNTGFTGGSISVKGQSACGIAGTAKSVTLQYLPPTPTSITSSTGLYNACIGDIITYTVFVPAPTTAQRVASVYRWTKPNNTTILSAIADSSNITVSFNAGYTGGSLTVKGQTACGVLGTAKTQALTHTACLPTTKVGNAITGALGMFDVNIFPNPTKSAFNVRIVSNSKESFSVRVLDLQGRLIKSMVLFANEINSVGNDLKSGVYMFEVTQGKEKQTLRAVKY